MRVDVLKWDPVGPRPSARKSPGFRRASWCQCPLPRTKCHGTLEVPEGGSGDLCQAQDKPRLNGRNQLGKVQRFESFVRRDASLGVEVLLWNGAKVKFGIYVFHSMCRERNTTNLRFCHKKGGST